MLQHIKWFVLAALLLSGPPSARAATLVTFDDLPGPSGEIPDGYAGLNWDFFLYHEPSTPVAELGVVSSPKTALTISEGIPGGISFASIKAPTAMDFIGGYFSSVVGDLLYIDVSGYADGVMTYHHLYFLDQPGSAYIQTDFLAVDAVYFNAFSGGGATNNAAFQIDNLSVAIYPTPVPGAFALFGCALLTLWAIRKKPSRTAAC